MLVNQCLNMCIVMQFRVQCNWLFVAVFLLTFQLNVDMKTKGDLYNKHLCFGIIRFFFSFMSYHQSLEVFLKAVNIYSAKKESVHTLKM